MVINCDTVFSYKHTTWRQNTNSRIIHKLVIENVRGNIIELPVKITVFKELADFLIDSQQVTLKFEREGKHEKSF